MTQLPVEQTTEEHEISKEATSTPSTFTIHTSSLFDPKLKKFIPNTSITINATTGLITHSYTRTGPLASPLPSSDIDLTSTTLTTLPGLVDAHTHIFLHAYSTTSSYHQETSESLPERIIRATNHCRTALLAGYTTYRDLGTEGAFDCDAAVRNCVNRGLTPGPRLFVATEALASSAGYAIRQENALGGVQLPRIADSCDGVDGCRAAVRRRVGAGADVIKFYASYRKRPLRFPAGNWPGEPDVIHPPKERNPDLLLFTQPEMEAMVAEARVSKCPIAAHCGNSEAVAMAAKAGVTTVEHGFECDEEGLKAMKEHGVIWVPTLTVFSLYYPMEKGLRAVKKGWEMGIRIAAGGDTGAFEHGENVRELELLKEAGVPLEDVLEMATVGGWEACGGDLCGRRFGWSKEGCAADLVAVEGDLEGGDLGALRRVSFVVKDGRVWKRDGVAVGMV